MFTSVKRFLFCVLMMVPVFLTAQKTADTDVTVLDYGQKRYVITARNQNQILELQQLTPGKTYALIAPPDLALGSCIPDIEVVEPTAVQVSWSSKHHALNFTATASTARVTLNYPCSWQADDPPRHYISMMCLSCTERADIRATAEMAVLEVDSAGAEELIKDVFIGGDCFDVTNISMSGGSNQIGKFLNGATNIGFNTGIMLVTGDIDVAIGPNDQDGAGSAGNGGTDIDLVNIATGPMYDVSTIEFDFTPTQSVVTFDYVFASEEYCEYVNTQFNDVFGFFISGPGINGAINLATVGNSTPVTINTINHITNSALYVHNTPPDPDRDNCQDGGIMGGLSPATPSLGQATQECEFDGYTRRMTAVANVIPCATYHIKLAIADVGDGLFDSAVFLRAGSFFGGGNASIKWVVNDDPNISEVTEGCGDVKILVERLGANVSNSLTVECTVTGSAASGSDFTPIPDTITIPAGQKQVLFPVNIPSDALLEGTETVILTLNPPCSCLHPQEVLNILDYKRTKLYPDTISVCGPIAQGTMGVQVEGGQLPYTYLWSTGSTEQTMSTSVSISSTFTVTVTDACGKTAEAYSRINVKDAPVAKFLLSASQLCPGETAVLQVDLNGNGPFQLQYTLNGTHQTPIWGTYGDPYLFLVNQPGVYTLTGVVDSLGCVGAATGSVNLIPSDLAISAISSNPAACPLSTDGTITVTATGGSIPYKYDWTGNVPIGNMPNPTNLIPGQYSVTVTDFWGCTQTQNLILVAPSPFTPSAVIQGVTCSAPLAGSIDVSVTGGEPEYTYKWFNDSTTNSISNLAAGSYMVTISDNRGCTTIYTAVIPADTVPPLARAIVDSIPTCANNTVSLNGTNSSAGPDYSYQWFASPGIIVSGENTLTPVINQGGNYTLLVRNTLNGCTSSATVNVLSEPGLPLANAGPDAAITCLVDTVILIANGSSQGGEFQYHWTASGGGAIIGPDTMLTVTTTTAGIYSLQITNTTNGCTSSDVVSVLLNTITPTVSVTGGDINCSVPNLMIQGISSISGPDISYYWSPGPGGNILIGVNTSTPVVNAPGFYTLTVVNANNGCRDTATAFVGSNLTSPVALTAPDGVITCAVPTVNINTAGSSVGMEYTYQWLTPAGQYLTGTSVQASTAGTYTLLVTNLSNGCTASTTAIVESNLTPLEADAGDEITLTCTQQTLGLSGSGSGATGLTYQWTTSNGSFVSATNIPDPVVDQPGIYTLTVTNPDNGCTASSSVTINQAPNLPIAAIGVPPSLTCELTTLNLNATGSSSGTNFTCQWTASNGGHIVNGAGTLTPQVDEPGTYSLLVTDLSNQCTKTAFVILSEDVSPPIADAGAGGTITCANTQVVLSGSVQTPQNNYSVLWTASNGGNIVGSTTALSPTVNEGGTYTMTVKNLVNGCTSSDLVNIQEDQIPPVAVITSPDTLTCTNQTVVLNSSGSSTNNVNYGWTTGNGHYVQPVNPSMPAVDQPGTYTLLVTYVNNGCTASATVTIPQDIQHPDINAGADGMLTCAVTSVQLSGSVTGPGNFAYQWIPSGGGQIISGGSTPSAVAGSGGTYTLIVTNTSNGCTSSDVASVNTETQIPAVAIATPGIISCVVPQVLLNGSGSQTGPTIQYSWTTTDGQIVSTSGPTCMAGKSGTYNLNVLNTANGCSSQQSVTVTDNIQLPSVEAGPSPTLNCTVVEATLLGNGSSTGQNYTYSWSTQDGNILSGNYTLTPVVNEPGTYTLQVTNTATGCKNTDNVLVLIDTNIPTDIVIDLKRPGCRDNDGVIRFTEVKGGTGPYLYSIDGGDTFVEDVDFSQITPGSYSLYIQDVNGCEYEENIVVPAAPDPAIAIPPYFELSLGDSLKLSATLPSGYPLSLIDTIIWTPVEGLSFKSNSIQDMLTPYVKPFSSGEYTVKIVSKDGCEDQDNVLIQVNVEPYIYIPSAFSPWKEDGDNDVFLIFADAKQIRQIDKFHVFDRWGEMVFSDSNFPPNDPAHGWNGYHNGQLMVPAVFVYYAEISLIDGRKLSFKGDVTLVR
jgi:hypothetical protein